MSDQERKGEIECRAEGHRRINETDWCSCALAGLAGSVKISLFHEVMMAALDKRCPLLGETVECDICVAGGRTECACAENAAMAHERFKGNHTLSFKGIDRTRGTK